MKEQNTPHKANYKTINEFSYLSRDYKICKTQYFQSTFFGG